MGQIVRLSDADAQGEGTKKIAWQPNGLQTFSPGRMADVPFEIRKFQKTDFERLWCIDQACFDAQMAYSRPELAFYMRRAGAFTLVAEGEADGKPNSVLGFIVAEARRRSGHIITIDVVAEARRLGVGSALLQSAEDQLREAGARTVALETAVNNEAAIRFYKQKGYFVEKTVRGYYSGQLDALEMVKELTPQESEKESEKESKEEIG